MARKKCRESDRMKVEAPMIIFMHGASSAFEQRLISDQDLIMMAAVGKRLPFMVCILSFLTCAAAPSHGIPARALTTGQLIEELTSVYKAYDISMPNLEAIPIARKTMMGRKAHVRPKPARCSFSEGKMRRGVRFPLIRNAYANPKTGFRISSNICGGSA